MRALVIAALLAGCGTPRQSTVRDAAAPPDATADGAERVDGRPSDASTSDACVDPPVTWCDGYHGLVVNGACEDFCGDFPYCPSGGVATWSETPCGAALCLCAKQ